MDQEAYPKKKAMLIAIGKIIPTPRKVIEVWDDLLLGLSMILYLSAILK
ncbi:hypothetical protein [Flavobacterium sp. LB1P71]